MIEGRRSEQGFTLIELMIVVVLVAILMTGVTNLLVTGLKSGGRAGTLALVREQGETAINTMERSLRFGRNLTCDLAGNWVSFERAFGDNWILVGYKFESSKIYQGRDEDSNGALEADEYTDLTGDNVEISNFMIACDFNAIPNKVNISFTINDINAQSFADYQTSVSMRNKNQ